MHRTWSGLLCLMLLLTAACTDRWVTVDQGNEARPLGPIEWRVVEAPLHAVWTPDGQTLWAAGDSGFLLRSSDAGKSWERLETGTDLDLLEISGSSDGQKLWLVSREGRLLHSKNNGTTWEEVSLPLVSARRKQSYLPEFNSKLFWTAPDGQVSFMLAEDGKILRRLSQNGWEILDIEVGTEEPAKINGIQTDQGNIIWVCKADGSCLLSSNGGVSWTGLLPAAFPNDREPERFSLIFSTGQPGGLSALQGGAGKLPIASKSSDFGETWNAKELDFAGPPSPSIRYSSSENADFYHEVKKSSFVLFDAWIDTNGDSAWLAGSVLESSSYLSLQGAGSQTNLPFHGIWKTSFSSANGISTPQLVQQFDHSTAWLGRSGSTLFLGHPQHGELLATRGDEFKLQILRQSLPTVAGIEAFQRSTKEIQELLVVGTDGTTVWSQDGGQTWKQIKSTHDSAFTFTATSQDGQTIWAGGTRYLYRFDLSAPVRNLPAHCTELKAELALEQVCTSMTGNSLWAIRKPLQASSNPPPPPFSSPASEPRHQRTLVQRDSTGWKAYQLPDMNEPKAVECQGDDVWALDTQNHLWKYPGIGGQWQSLGEIARPKGVAINDLLVVSREDTAELFAAGTNGTILRSADGGDSWRQTWSDATEDLTRLVWSNKNQELWAIGEGVLLRSGDGGRYWNRIQTSGSGDTYSRAPADITFGELGSPTWLASHNSALIRGEQSSKAYPHITKARLVNDIRGPRLELVLKGTQDWPEGIQLRLFAGNANNSAQGVLAGINSEAYERSAGDGAEAEALWAFDLTPAAEPIDVEPGENLHAHVEVVADGFRQLSILPPLRYAPWSWLHNNWPWLALLATASLLEILRRLRPLWLVAIARLLPLSVPTEEISFPSIRKIIKDVTRLTLVPTILQSDRVLDAWTRRALPTLKKRFEEQATVQASRYYTPLPVRLGSGALLSHKLSRHFQG